MLDSILNFTSDVEILVAGIGAVVFAISYAAFFNWRKTVAGRSLMYFILSLIAITIVSALGRWIGVDYPLRSLVRFAVYTSVLIVMWRLVIVLWLSWRSKSISTDKKKRK